MSGAARANGAGQAASQWDPQLLELGTVFGRVARALKRLRGRDTHLGGSEVSHAQFELLGELFERGELPAGELAAAAALAPGTVTQMLDHLADCGQVERARSETDRRVVVTRLTDQGRGKVEAKREAWRGRWEDALDGFGPEEVQAATRVLERLGAMFEEASAGAPEEGPQGGAATAQKPRGG